MADEQVNIDLTARDKASKPIDKVADAVEDLEDRSPVELAVEADGRQAAKVIEGVGDDAEALAKADHELKLTARVDALKRELREAQGALDATREHAEDADKAVGKIGGEQRVGAIRDLTGPLGEVSTAVGDFGDAAVAAGEQFGAALGLSEQSMGRMLGWLGPLGIAGGLVFTLWQNMRKGADETRQKIADTTSAIMDMGETAAAVDKVRDLLRTDPKLLDDVNALGLSYQDLVDAVSGKAVPQFEAWRSAMANVRADLHPLGDDIDDTASATGRAARALGLTTEEYLRLLPAAKNVGDTFGEQVDLFDAGRTAAGKYNDLIGRQLSPTMVDVADKAQAAGVDVGALTRELHGVPPSTRADVTVTTDDRELDASKGKVDDLDGRRVHVTVDASPSDRLAAALTNATLPPGWGTRSASAPAVVNLTVHAPAGTRPAELVRAGERYARRNGGGRARR